MIPIIDLLKAIGIAMAIIFFIGLGITILIKVHPYDF